MIDQAEERVIDELFKKSDLPGVDSQAESLLVEIRDVIALCCNSFGVVMRYPKKLFSRRGN